MTYAQALACVVVAVVIGPVLLYAYVTIATHAFYRARQQYNKSKESW